MVETKILADNIINMAIRSGHHKIGGEMQFAKGVFTFLYQEMNLHFDLLLFCTKKGLILDFIDQDAEYDITGHTVSIENLRNQHEEFLFYEALEDYIIISPNLQELVPTIIRLQNNIQRLLSLYGLADIHSQNLLDSFNSVKNAISIYDQDARLLFGNKYFFKNFHVEDEKQAIGKTIDEIMSLSGTKVQSISSNTSRLKMFDVLEKGEDILDWEVRMESKNESGNGQIISNDMYPIKGRDGHIQGLVEIARSRQQDMKRTRKIIGLAAEYSFDDIICNSLIMKEKIRMSKDYASSEFNFLITGESGVGKELFAQSIHNYSPRQKGPFVAINCANFSEGLIESELFGYVGGAFTGASKNGQIGKFELADGGTLFLDEIGELPYNFQSKLLRVLETWVVTRIGSSKPIPVNVRLIAATNRNLEEMVKEGLFRQDLYYRLQVLTVDIPPLRDRRDDLIPIAEFYLNNNYTETKSLEKDAKNLLLNYDWPGNVRELRNVINRATVLSKSATISRESLEASIYSSGFKLNSSASEGSPQEILHKCKANVEAANIELINAALNNAGGNKTKAAELLDVSRNTFYRMLEKYGILSRE